MRTLGRWPGVYLVLSLFVTAIVALGATGLVVADSPPTDAEIEFATETADLLEAELFSETTPDNVEQGKLAISLIFAHDNSAFRLVGEIKPLSKGNKPKGNFEEESLALALNGDDNATVEKVKGQYYVRRSIPLANFDPSCVLCHVNFGSTPSNTEFVGALMLKVPTDPGSINKLAE